MTLRYFVSIIKTVLTPNIAPIKVKGTKILKSLKSKILDFANLRELVKEPQDAENLLVPKAKYVGIPVSIYAGRLISPPPPAIESTKVAKKPAIHKNIKVLLIILLLYCDLCVNITMIAQKFI
ncbi:hypothetical protein D3C73_1161480 [compost metagenome]